MLTTAAVFIVGYAIGYARATWVHNQMRPRVFTHLD